MMCSSLAEFGTTKAPVDMDNLSLPSFQMAGLPPLSTVAGPVMQVSSTFYSSHSMASN